MSVFYRLIALLSLVGLITTNVMGEIVWVEKAQNPAYFPYMSSDSPNEFYMDFPIPNITNRVWNSITDAGVPFTTNVALLAESDPMYGTEGYWPCYRAIGIFANDNYYIGGGAGPNINLHNANLKGRNPDNGDILSLGYLWPSNSLGKGFSFNRQSGFAVYDVLGDSWNACKWDGTGPIGYNYGRYPDSTPGHLPGGTSWPQGSDGTQITPNQAFAFDIDEDGTEEIFWHGGYPIWGGYCAIFDPDENAGQGSWSKTADSLDFSSGYKAQYGGGAVRINSNIWCIGGVYWGPNDGTHMQRYSVSDDTWEKYEYLHSDALDSFGIATVDSKIYMLGGYVGRAGRTSAGVATNAVFMLDTDNIAAGITIVGRLAVPVADPAVISWKGLLYLVGGESGSPNGNFTNLFQIFNPLTGATVIHEARLPVNASSPSCAVTPSGQFLFGGAMRIQEGNKYFNSSRLWSAPLPEQDIFVAPTILEYGQTTDQLQIQIDNVTGLSISCTTATSAAWLTISDPVVDVGAAAVFIDVNINRTTLLGPVNAIVNVSWADGSVDVQVSADTPRPVGSLNPREITTLRPATKSFTIANSGSVAMNFTNETVETYIANLAPATGVVAPTSSVVVTFDVTVDAPRPSTGLINTTYNSYNGTNLTVTVNNYPFNYYVATDGDNANNGITATSAWQTIGYGIANMPNGSESEGPITLSIAAGTYAGETTEVGGTNWFLFINNREYINIMGAGPQQTILTKGSANWPITPNNDSIPEKSPIQISDSAQVRISGMTILADDPPAKKDGIVASYPEHCAAVAVYNGNGIQLDHLYLAGTYKGDVYNVQDSTWEPSWEGWWYHGIVVGGVIGEDDLHVNNVLIQGFQRAVYNNNFSWGGDLANLNYGYFDHCTFVEQTSPSGIVQGVNLRVEGTEYGPTFVVHNSIIAGLPVETDEGTLDGEGLIASSISSFSNMDYTLLSQSNQFYAVGVPYPGINFVNINVVQEDSFLGLVFTDYTNEAPAFIEVGGLPFSTQKETVDGFRDVGWNPVPEPSALIALLACLALLFKR